MYTVGNLHRFNNNSVRPGSSTSTNNNKVVDSNYNKKWCIQKSHWPMLYIATSYLQLCSDHFNYFCNLQERPKDYMIIIELDYFARSC
jgi:hypothetical protein